MKRKSSKKKLAKKPAKKKATPMKPTILREVQIRFKRKRVKAGAKAAKPVTDPRQIVELFQDLADESKEKLISIALDNKMRIVCFEVVAVGSKNCVYVHPADALRSAVIQNALGIIVVHNHTSGDPDPSKDDCELTDILAAAAGTLRLRLFDHIVIGEDGKYFSFAESGHLPNSGA